MALASPRCHIIERRFVQARLGQLAINLQRIVGARELILVQFNLDLAPR
jgi:hypothetical protein